MYVDHFKLSERTFTNGPEAGFFMPNEQVEAAIARARQVMVARDSMAIVTGGPGVGKSAFIAAAHATIEDKAVIANIDLRQTDADQLLDMLLLSLGAQAGDGNEAESLHRLKKIIREHNEAGRRVTAVVDVTGLTVDRAKRILQLIHTAGEPGCQLNIILLGPHALHRLLNAPGLIHLRQRVCYRYRVRPLTVDEVDRYLEEQFERAGGSIASVLNDGAGETVFRFVGGVPRLINTLMDAVLSEAAVRDVERAGPELINEVARELGWKPLTGGQPAAARPAAARSPAARPNVAPQATPKPPELAVEQQASPPRPKLPLEQQASPPAPMPVSEASAMLLLDPQVMVEDDTTRAPMPDFPKATDKLGDNSGVPMMNADDTSATGMLRLEDLDARFAETIFGEDATKSASDAIAATPELPENVAN